MERKRSISSSLMPLGSDTTLCRCRDWRGLCPTPSAAITSKCSRLALLPGVSLVRKPDSQRFFGLLSVCLSDANLILQSRTHCCLSLGQRCPPPQLTLSLGHLFCLHRVPSDLILRRSCMANIKRKCYPLQVGEGRKRDCGRHFGSSEAHSA